MQVIASKQKRDAGGSPKSGANLLCLTAGLVIYVATLWAGNWFAWWTTVGEYTLTAFWLPTGIAFGALLITRRRVWPLLLLIATAVYAIYAWSTGRFATGLEESVFHALAIHASVWAGAAILGRGRPFRLIKVGDVALLFVVAIATTCASAAASAGWYWSRGLNNQFSHQIYSWWLGHALGILVVVPWVIALRDRGLIPGMKSNESGVPHHSAHQPNRWIRGEAALILMAILGLGWFTLTASQSSSSVLGLTLFLFPLLIWLAVRFGTLLNASALLLLAIVFALQVQRGTEYFVPVVDSENVGNLSKAAVSIQVYLLATSFGVLILSTVVQERQRAAFALKQNVDQFDVLMTTLRPTVWLMELPGATLTYLSDSFGLLTGRNPASMIGRPGAWKEIVHPDDRSVIEVSLENMIKYGYEDTEYRIVRTDGTVRWVREQTSPVKSEDGVIRQIAGSVEDVTHRHRAAEQRDIIEAELLESTERYQGFMKISGEAVWRAETGEPIPLDLPFDEFIDRVVEHSWIAECNDAFARMYGYNHPDEAVGTKLLDNFRLYDKFNLDYIRRFHAGGCRYLTTESRRVMPDGEVRWYMANFSGVVEDGELLRLWGTLTDITAQHRLEEQVREAQRFEAMGQLSAGVAHDFNNLLAVISAHTELLEGRVDPDEKVTASLGAVREAIDHAAGVSRSLMAFSQELPSKREPIDLVAVIQQTQRMVARSIPGVIELVLDLPEAGLPAVMGDAVQMQQVLINLVLNARDAIGEAGGQITVAVEADEMSPDTAVRIAVQDNGRGMDESTRLRVFDPFFTTKSETGGTGLGLSVVRGIVAEHEGKIAVSSRLGYGTTVTVELPAVENIAGLTPGRTYVDTPIKGSEPSVLLAEDDEQVRGVMASALQARGYRVLLAENTQDLRRIYDDQIKQRQPIDIIVTDVEMPGGSGLEVVRQLRQEGHQTPAIVVTGSVTVKLDPVEDGPTVLMNKPFGIGDLCGVVQNQLAPHEAMASNLPGSVR